MLKKTKLKIYILLCLSGLLVFQTIVFSAGIADEKKKSSWAIYWYLCGSDLESQGGAATMDLQELLQVDLPEDVTIVIETGGAKSWKNDMVDANYLERYVVSSKGIKCVAQEKSAPMGDGDTLADFLKFCKKNYPADQEGVIIWNHGGGSVQGAAFDELYDFDALTLEELHKAFAQVYKPNAKKPPLEMIGFDCCLMATIDTASAFQDIAKYMVASEELEPGSGWDYENWVKALAKNTAMDGAELGKKICDTYYKSCDALYGADEITLSVVNLSTLPNLLDAYDQVGKEALDYVMEDAAFFAQFSKGAKQAENYGGNTNAAGYSNLVDLGSLMKCNQKILPEYSKEVLRALAKSVVYKINGKYRAESSGLSCYFSYNKDKEELKQYLDIGVSDAFNDLYAYGLTGEISDSFQDYIDSNYEADEEEIEEVPVLEYAEDEEIPVSFDDDGYAMIQVDKESLDALSGVYCEMGIWDEEENMVIWYGYDNDVDADWDKGTFRDNFRGVWGCIDGHLCYMDLIYEGDDYNLYLVPVLLNGEEYQLHVAYDYDLEEYEILGARKGFDDNGMSDRNLRQLKKGDQLTTLLYVGYGEEEEELYEFDSFKVSSKIHFSEEELGDGEFIMSFLLSDSRGNEKWSEQILFTVEDGEISTDYF